jgi:hypothetical protein
MHRLADNEELLGWLYVGTPKKDRSERKSKLDVEKHLTEL